MRMGGGLEEAEAMRGDWANNTNKMGRKLPL